LIKYENEKMVKRKTPQVPIPEWLHPVGVNLLYIKLGLFNYLVGDVKYLRQQVAKI